MKTCQLKKTCCICRVEKHNLEFQSDRKGRTGIKSYCKTCTNIYQGIKQNLILADEYIGKNYDFNTLTGDKDGTVYVLHGQAYSELSIDRAVQFIKQGAAYITSPCTIRSFKNSKASKEKISDSFRQEVFKRDGRKCHYCNKHATSVDHVVPRCKGGLNTLLNLVSACIECNMEKSHMSKQQYLRLKKEGFNIPKNSQKKKKKEKKKSNIKIMVAKIDSSCKGCKKETETHITIKNDGFCDTCNLFKEAFGRGWILTEKLKTVQVSRKMLKGSYFNVITRSKKMHVVDKQTAKYYLLNGLAEVVDSSTIQMLFTQKQVNLLKPMLTQIQKKDLLSDLLTGSMISVYDLSQKHAFTVDIGEAVEMVQKNVAVPLKKNRLQLTVEREKALSLKIFNTSAIPNSGEFTRESLANVASVFDNLDEYVGTIHRHQALKLLDIGKASMVKHNRIVIKVECKEEVIPLMQVVVDKKIRIRETNGNIIGTIPYELKSEVEHLIAIELAEKDSENLVTLRKSANQLIQEFPKMAFLTELKKKNDVFILKEA